LTSEYVVNGLADWVNSIRFAERVSGRLADDGIEIPAAALFGTVSAEAIRSRLTVVVNYGDPDQLVAVMDAVIEVITEQNGAGIPHLNGETAAVLLLDEPIINEIAPSITGQLDLPLRIIIAIFVGVVIGLAVEYFDPYIRSGDELEAAGLDVWGEL